MASLTQLNMCANCLVFNWDEDGGIRLQQCSKCKILQYCGQPCQEEHWLLVHKEHCKKLVKAKARGGASSEDPVGMWSHHPFPKEGLPEDIAETLVVQMQRILSKMRQVGHPAYEGSMHADMVELEENLVKSRRGIWSWRKVMPEQNKNFCPLLKPCRELHIRLNQPSLLFEDETWQDLWSTLHLVWGRLLDHEVITSLDRLKDPRDAMPPKMWKGVEEEVGHFPARLKELLDALTSDTDLPSFKDLLRVYCGGSLEQSCTSCLTTINVEAVEGEAEGMKMGVPTVCLQPFLPILFSCSEQGCYNDLLERIKAWLDWASAVSMTYDKLSDNRCDNCFKFSEDVHRWSAHFLVLPFLQVREVLDQDVVQPGVPGGFVGINPRALLLTVRAGGEEGEERQLRGADGCRS